MVVSLGTVSSYSLNSFCVHLALLMYTMLPQGKTNLQQIFQLQSCCEPSGTQRTIRAFSVLYDSHIGLVQFFSLKVTLCL